MRPIDPYSYHCGVMDSFCEIVAAGIKPMALSHLRHRRRGRSTGSMSGSWQISMVSCWPRRTACR